MSLHCSLFSVYKNNFMLVMFENRSHCSAFLIFQHIRRKITVISVLARLFLIYYIYIYWNTFELHSQIFSMNPQLYFLLEGFIVHECAPKANELIYDRQT